MQRLTPQERVLRARLAVHTKWAQTGDRTAATAPARASFMKRFEVEVDPDNQLTPADRTRRAEHARKAYFARLALQSAKARRIAKGAPQAPAEGAAEGPAEGAA